MSAPPRPTGHVLAGTHEALSPSPAPTGRVFPGQLTPKRANAIARPVPPRPTATRLPERNLDVLRALAVLCVLGDHVLFACHRSLPFITNWELGRAGVLLFFVHTALVLMSSLERRAGRKDWIRAFYIRRAFRIYPLAIATVAAVALAAMPPDGGGSWTGVPGFVAPSIATLAANLGLVQNLVGRPNLLGVLWSLPVEMQTYLGLPAAFVLAKRGTRAVLAGFLATIALGFAVRHASWPGVWRLSAGVYAPCFMAGVLAYTVLRRRPKPLLPAWLWVVILGAWVPILAVLGPTFAIQERGWLFSLAVGGAIPWVKDLSSSWFTRFAHQICSYSYGIYLLHLPALWCAFSLLRRAPGSVQWLTFAVLLVGLPVLTYRLIEAPGIRLGKWLVHEPA